MILILSGIPVYLLLQRKYSERNDKGIEKENIYKQEDSGSGSI
jgi:hypothetical protein